MEAGRYLICFSTQKEATRKLLSSESTDGESTPVYGVSAFNSNGFSLNDSYTHSNSSVVDGGYVAWSFRKQPGFFDIQTYTGSGENGQTINHDLDAVPGMVIIKHTSSNGSKWYVFHRSLDSGKHLKLSSNSAESSDSNYEIGKTTCTSTQFSIDTGSEIDASGQTYIAYFFAHNDQRFGTGADEAIIKCDSYQGNGDIANQGEVDVNVGFEPQWILIKRADGSNANWMLIDMMRGFGAHGSSSMLSLHPNTSDAELLGEGVEPTTTGFRITDDDGKIGANAKYVYVAIRRPHKPVSEFAATDLFDPQTYTGNGSTRVFTGLSTTPDMTINLSLDVNGDSNAVNDRLRGSGRELYTNGADAEYGAGSAGMQFDYAKGIEIQNYRYTNTKDYINYHFKRVPGFFDIVLYTGTGSAQNISHNFGVAPELMLVKNRSSAYSWMVYHSGLGATKYLRLNTNGASVTHAEAWNDTAPTSSVFTVNDDGATNNSGDDFVAYLFTTVAGISKVGTYSGQGLGYDINIDCGFSSGARFVLVKRTDSTGDWFLWDSDRGINASPTQEPYYKLNDNAAEANEDYISTFASGFSITSRAGFDTGLNASGGTYAFFAIA